jgi:hypothetical protein
MLASRFCTCDEDALDPGLGVAGIGTHADRDTSTKIVTNKKRFETAICSDIGQEQNHHD